jgi:hypothetical protein
MAKWLTRRSAKPVFMGNADIGNNIDFIRCPSGCPKINGHQLDTGLVSGAAPRHSTGPRMGAAPAFPAHALGSASSIPCRNHRVFRVGPGSVKDADGGDSWMPGRSTPRSLTGSGPTRTLHGIRHGMEDAMPGACRRWLFLVWLRLVLVGGFLGAGGWRPAPPPTVGGRWPEHRPRRAA